MCDVGVFPMGITDEMGLRRETLGHLRSAYCKGQAKVVTKAHHNCFRELQHDLASNAGGRDDSVEFCNVGAGGGPSNKLAST